MATSTEAIHLFDVGRTSHPHLISYKQPYLFYIESFGSRLTDVVASERLTVPSYFAVSNYSVYRAELIDSLSLATSLNQNSTVIESYRITKN